MLIGQIAPETHWPEMEALIFVVSDAKKDIGSTVGMQRTLQTSPLIQERIAKVPGTMKRMEAAILSRDFDAFAELTMRDSNQFHAVCMDTFPPVFYLTDVSKGIIQTVTLYNQLCQARGLGYRAAYTFDAGPNAVVFLKREHVSQFLGIMNYFFPCPSTDLERASEYYGRAMDFVNFWEQDEETREFLGQMEKLPVFPKGSFKRIISTQVGDGPRLLASTYEPSVSLLDDKGWPVSIV